MIDIFVISKITQYRYYVIAITDVRSLGLSTKWRTLMIKKTMKVRENTFRKLEDPFENGAAKKYVFYVKVDDVAEGIPMATNPRDQKLTSGVATAIKESLLSNDGYDIFKVETNGVVWMAIYPKDNVGLIMLRRDRAKVEKITGLNCAIFLDRTTFYIKEKLLEEGIPFVPKGKQVYLPFIGYLLSNANERELTPVYLISFLTQKMLLVAIYERWNEVKVSEAAERLSVSRKSASRCFDELEYLNIDVLGMKGKSRVINVPDDRKEFWKENIGILRNPVIRKFVLREDIKLEKKAGISALCEYSLLSDNAYPTYAVTKKKLKASGVKMEKQASVSEDIGCVVLELGYFIDFFGKGLQDPLSVALSLTREEQEERVKISVNEMLEEYVWSKD